MSKPTVPAARITDQDITTTPSRRRAFLKAVGGGTLLLAAGAVTAGCSKRSDTCRTTVDTDPRDPVSGRLVCDGD